MHCMKTFSSVKTNHCPPLLLLVQLTSISISISLQTSSSLHIQNTSRNVTSINEFCGAFFSLSKEKVCVCVCVLSVFIILETTVSSDTVQCEPNVSILNQITNSGTPGKSITNYNHINLKLERGQCLASLRCRKLIFHSCDQSNSLRLTPWPPPGHSIVNRKIMALKSTAFFSIFWKCSIASVPVAWASYDEHPA